MKKIAIAIFVMALTGCSHYYYAPNAANIPLLKEKNDFTFKGGYSGDFYSGADIQMAYAVSKNFGVMLNSFFVGESELVQRNLFSSETYKESGTGSFVEAAGGYYKPFGNHKVWIFETYAGAGVGGETHVYDYSQNAKLNFTKFFVQPSLGYSSKKEHFQFAISSRFSGLNLKIKSSNLSTETDQYEKQNLDSISSRPSSLLWEPSFLIAAGGKGLKLYLQLTISKNLNNPTLSMDPSNLSFGIKVNFRGKSK